MASDAHNRTVESLGKEDFAIVDNEMVIRRFRSLSRAPESKLAITLLVDTSESVAPQFREHVSEMLQRLLNSDSMVGDEVTVVAFGGMQPRVVCSGNCRELAMAKRLFEQSPQGATPLFDAVVLAAKMAAQHADPQVRPVFIIFSDGADTISRNSAADALQAVIACDAQIYAVNVRNFDDGSSESRTLQNMAEATGGGYFLMHEGVAELLQHVLDDLHFAYVVTYELPERKEGTHSVRILPTRNLTLRFRSRRIYYETNVP